MHLHQNRHSATHPNAVTLLLFVGKRWKFSGLKTERFRDTVGHCTVLREKVTVHSN